MILLRGKLVENRPLDVVRDAWRTITRAAYRAIGLYWVLNMLPRHFEPGAANRYGYEMRSQAYLLRKHGTNVGNLRSLGLKRSEIYTHLRRLDNDEPLQLTGYMKRAVQSQYVVRGFPTRATVILHGPAYMNAKLGAGFRNRRDGKGGTFVDYSRRQPDKVKELTTVRGDEREVLAKVLTQEIRAGITSYRGTKTTE